ncbi:MAG: DMT family transporter [bacterium]
MLIILFAGLVPMFLWGINAIFEKKFVAKTGTLKPLLYVNLISTILNLPFLLTEKFSPELTPKFLITIFVFTIFDFIGLALFYIGFRISKVSIVTPIASCFSILTTLISVFYYGEVISIAKIFCIVLVIAGIIVLSVDFKDLKSTTKKDLIGIICGLIIFILYGIWVPLWSKFIATGGVFHIMTYSRMICFALAAIFLIFTKSNFKVDCKNMILIFISAFLLLIANNVYNWGLATANATSLITAISSAYPLIAALTAYFVLKEKLVRRQYVGIGIIITGIVLIALV